MIALPVYRAGVFCNQAGHQPCQRLLRVAGKTLPKRCLCHGCGLGVREQLELCRRYFARHGQISEYRVQSPMLRYRVMGSRVY